MLMRQLCMCCKTGKRISFALHTWVPAVFASSPFEPPFPRLSGQRQTFSAPQCGSAVIPMPPAVVTRPPPVVLPGSAVSRRLTVHRGGCEAGRPGLQGQRVGGGPGKGQEASETDPQYTCRAMFGGRSWLVNDTEL
eukprot:1147761-Pelagomonas_calceolata.AAC.4